MKRSTTLAVLALLSVSFAACITASANVVVSVAGSAASFSDADIAAI